MSEGPAGGFKNLKWRNMENMVRVRDVRVRGRRMGEKEGEKKERREDFLYR